MSGKTIHNIIEEFYRGIESELPPPSHTLGHCEDFRVSMRDGVKLMTRVYFPEGTGPWPVILVRHPYFPVNSDLLEQARSAIFVKYGYAVVLQQVRGLYDSEGEWLPLENERNDGLDTIGWIIKQQWMNGSMATFGGSYLGHVQWCLADAVPQEVKTMHFSIYSGKSYERHYRNGMFKQGIWTLWAGSMMGDVNPTPDKIVERFKTVLPVRPPVEIGKYLTGLDYEWFYNWVTNPCAGDEYWNTGFWKTYKEVVEKVKIPLFIHSGWFDIFIDSVLETFNDLPAHIREQSRFVLNPWNHSLQTGADLDCPDSKNDGFWIKCAIEWFDHHLKGKPYNYPKGVIEAYVMRDGTWKTWTDRIVPSNKSKYYLNISNDQTYKGGTLTGQPPEKMAAVQYAYDPSNPVPTKGGTLLANLESPLESPGTSVVQDEPGSREDVITFISEVLENDVAIAGEIQVCLHISSDAEDTAFTAKISEVFPDGKAYNIRDDITSLAYRNNALQPLTYNPKEVIAIELNLPTITWTLKKGSRIRLDISSSNYPYYHAHPNTTATWSLQKEGKVANQTVYTGGSYQSYIEIPFVL